ncbi:hypothetical protein SUDANB176_03878 [Streptomyces sp. enrichment culture]
MTPGSSNAAGSTRAPTVCAPTVCTRPSRVPGGPGRGGAAGADALMTGLEVPAEPGADLGQGRVPAGPLEERGADVPQLRAILPVSGGRAPSGRW